MRRRARWVAMLIVVVTAATVGYGATTSLDDAGAAITASVDVDANVEVDDDVTASVDAEAGVGSTAASGSAQVGIAIGGQSPGSGVGGTPPGQGGPGPAADVGNGVGVGVGIGERPPADPSPSPEPEPQPASQVTAPPRPAPSIEPAPAPAPDAVEPAPVAPVTGIFGPPLQRSSPPPSDEPEPVELPAAQQPVELAPIVSATPAEEPGLPAATLVAAALAGGIAAGAGASTLRGRPVPGAGWLSVGFGALAASQLPAVLFGLPDDGSLRDRVAVALLAIPPWAIAHQVRALTLAGTRWLRVVDAAAIATAAWALLVPTDVTSTWSGADTATVLLWLFGAVLVLVAWLAVRRMLALVARTDPRIARIRGRTMHAIVVVFLLAYVAWIVSPIASATHSIAAIVMAIGSAGVLLVAVLPRPAAAAFDRLGGRAMVHATEVLVASDDVEHDLPLVLDRFADALGVDGVALVSHGAIVEFGGHAAIPRRMGPGGVPPQLVEQVEHSQLVAWPALLVPQAGSRRRERMRIAARLLHAALERERLRSLERRASDQVRETATALAAANRSLQETNELKGQFVSLVSHELRTPLTSIIGLARTAHERWEELDEARLREFQRIIADQGDRLDRLVRELLLIGRIEEGRITVTMQTVGLADVVEQAIVDAGIDGGRVHVHRPQSLEHVRTDPTFLHEVLVNYLSNARKYGEPPIDVRIARRDGVLEIAVDDRGEPIPASFRPQLFQRFTRAESDTTIPGTGLGLAIVRELAQALGGQAWHEPLARGGNRFAIRVPVDWVVDEHAVSDHQRTGASTASSAALHAGRLS